MAEAPLAVADWTGPHETLNLVWCSNVLAAQERAERVTKMAVST